MLKGLAGLGSFVKRPQSSKPDSAPSWTVADGIGVADQTLLPEHPNSSSSSTAAVLEQATWLIQPYGKAVATAVAGAQHLPLQLHLQHQLEALSSSSSSKSGRLLQLVLTPTLRSILSSSSSQDCKQGPTHPCDPQPHSCSHGSTSYHTARQQVAAGASCHLPKPLLQHARAATSLTLDVLQLPSLLAAAAQDRSILAVLVLGVTRLQLVGDMPVTLQDVLQPSPPSPAASNDKQRLRGSPRGSIRRRIKTLATAITSSSSSSSSSKASKQQAAAAAAAARAQQQLDKLLLVCCNLEHLDLSHAPQLRLPGQHSSSTTSSSSWQPQLRSLHIGDLHPGAMQHSPTLLQHLTHLVLTSQRHPVEWVGQVCTNLVTLELQGPPLEAQQQQQQGPAGTAAAAPGAACRVPGNLGRLSQLQKLTLQRLPGVGQQLPALAGALTALQQLDISRCGLRALPEGLGLLPRLQGLRATFNALPGITPTAARQLRRLTVLDLSGNFGLQLVGLGGLQQLQQLQLSRCGLKTLDQLSGLRRLSHLDVSHNSIRCVGNLAAAAQALTYLDLSHNPGECLSGSWAPPQQLRELHLDMPLHPKPGHPRARQQQQQQQQGLLAPLQGLACVTRVTLSWGLVGDNPGWLLQQPALVALRLGTHGLSSSSSLASCASKWLHLGKQAPQQPTLQVPSQLQELSLCGMPRLPASLSTLVHLRRLDLSRGRDWQAPLRALPKWLPALQQLEWLDISGNRFKKPPWEVVQQLPALVTLRALGCGCCVPARLQHMTWV